MDQPKLKNVYDKNSKFILVLYSVCTVWQSLQDCMLQAKYIEINIFKINKFTIFIIHVFELRLVHANQISTLFRKIFA